MPKSVAESRPLVIPPAKFGRRTVSVRFMGPDFLSYVDDEELPNFYVSAQAAVAAGQRYILEAEKVRGN